MWWEVILEDMVGCLVKIEWTCWKGYFHVGPLNNIDQFRTSIFNLVLIYFFDDGFLFWSSGLYITLTYNENPIS